MNNRARIPQLDGLRGIAILLVIVWHYVVCQLPPSHAAWIEVLNKSPLSISWSGVDLFFVLSGFLLGGILIENRASGSYFKPFFIRRFCRTLPLYYMVLVVFVLITSLGLYRSGKFDWLFADPFPLWSYATFTQGFFMLTLGKFGPTWLSVGWSLAVEEHFYLTLPFVIYFSAPRSLPWVLLGLILMSQALRFLVVYVFASHAHANFFLMPCRADSLLAGVLVAWASRNPQFGARIASNIKRFYGILAVLFAGVALLAYSQETFYSTLMSRVGYSWLALFYTALLLIVLYEKSGPLAWLCRRPLLREVGIVSYGIYLLHLPVSGLLHGLLDQSVPRLIGVRSAGITLLAFLVTLALARLSYVFFEKPIVNFGHQWRYRVSGAPVVPAPNKR